ncbi:hypothetical protein GDO78_018355 [Eleutherodactylus coqui]|uniref:Uncharacterized protein n=1 Tax=Eleutherodactylus coqui TaxID=57060 RepID=A0A8J6B0V0_ELECQ|nr:hypothetical protein GDO78_018355 [Eleutherodactylus coqui]
MVPSNFQRLIARLDELAQSGLLSSEWGRSCRRAAPRSSAASRVPIPANQEAGHLRKVSKKSPERGDSECSGDKIRPFLKYYETVAYNREELYKDHLRSKRATLQEQRPIQLAIFGYNRTFELMLSRDRSVFTDDFKVISDDATVPMDLSFVYSGKLKGKK